MKPMNFSRDYASYLRQNGKPKLVVEDTWVPFHSNGNLYLKGKLQPVGWFIRKGTEVNTSQLFNTKREAFGCCKRLNSKVGPLVKEMENGN